MKNKMTSYQLFAVTFFLSNGFLVTGIFPTLFKMTKTSSILVILLGTALGSVFVYFFSKIKKKNLLTILEEYFPKGFKILFEIILFLFFFLLASSLLFSETQYVIDTLLPGDNPILLAILFLLILLYIASKKLSILSRFTEMMFFLFVLFFLLLLAGLTPLANPTLLKPIIKDHLFEGTIFYFLTTTTPLFLLWFMEDEVEKEKRTKYMLTSYLIGNLVIFLLVVLTISILGIDLSMIYSYPEVVVLKKISYFSFLERMEGSLSIIYLIDLVIYLVLLLFAMRKILIHLFQKEHVLIDIVLGILLLFTTFGLKLPFLSLLYVTGGFFLSFSILLFFILKFAKKI